MSSGDGQGGDGLQAGTMLGRYEIRRQLGRGGMGAVYEAIHTDLRKRVAVKVLSPALAANEEARQRFLREGEAASRIRHPHVVDVTDVGSVGAVSYLVMEFLEGEDLSNRLARGPLSTQEVADVLLPVCAGVSAAHDEGVVHRDLKPENIFLARPRHGGGVQAKVLDFGVSKVSGGKASMALTGTAATFGTPFYMPPEQLRGARQADHRSDQYALGVVLYECLVGRRPFEAENIYAMLRAIGDGDYPLPRTLRPDLPEDIELIITRAMRLDPEQRFPSVRHFAAALLPFASEMSRVLWSDAFRVEGAAAEGPARSYSAGRTIALPPEGAAAVIAAAGTGSQPRVRTGGGIGGSGGSVSGTKILPSTPPPARAPSRGTTLGEAAGQSLTLAPRRRGSGVLIGGLIVAGAAAGVVVYTRASAPVPPTRHSARAETGTGEAPETTRPAARALATYAIDVETDPPGATIDLDGMPVSTGRLRRELPKDGSEHRIVARAAGYGDASVTFVDRPPPRRLVLTQVPAAEQGTPPSAVTAAHVDKSPKGSPPHGAHPPHHPGKPPAGPGPAAVPDTPAGRQPPPANNSATANGAPVID